MMMTNARSRTSRDPGRKGKTVKGKVKVGEER
jgi:hypothetical protein